jgi:lipid-binding SYLF domain-containing protein
VLLCPSVVRAGFIFGGRGGGCLLLGQANRNWSAPAFYGLGGASVGLQAGVQEMTLLMLIRTERGLRALLDGQFTLGATPASRWRSSAGNVSGATTTGAEADLISVARARGFFAGLSLEGSVIGERPQLTSAFTARTCPARTSCWAGWAATGARESSAMRSAASPAAETV